MARLSKSELMHSIRDMKIYLTKAWVFDSENLPTRSRCFERMCGCVDMRMVFLRFYARISGESSLSFGFLQTCVPISLSFIYVQIFFLRLLFRFIICEI